MTHVGPDLPKLPDPPGDHAGHRHCVATYPPTVCSGCGETHDVQAYLHAIRGSLKYEGGAPAWFYITCYTLVAIGACSVLWATWRTLVAVLSFLAGLGTL